MAVSWEMHLPVNEGLGTTLYNAGTLGSAGNGRHYHMAWTVDLTRDMCLERDGGLGYITTATMPGGQDATIAFWMYPHALSGTLFQRYNIALYLRSDGSLRLSLLGSGVNIYTAASVVAINTWYHVAVVTSSTGVTIYLDGSSVKNQTVTVPDVSKSAITFAFSTFDGLIQTIRFSDDVATGKDISDLYTAETTDPQVGTVVLPPGALPAVVAPRNNLTLTFDEELGVWAKSDMGFDVLAGYRGTDYEYAIIACRQCYVDEFDVGHNDGASVNEGYGALAGTVTSGGVYSITDSAAIFQTAGDGLAGCRLLAKPSGGEWQERTIIGNYATTLYVDSPFSPTVSGGTYVIAPIDFYWESKWMDLGDPTVRKRIYYLQAWLSETNTTHAITVKYKTEYDEDWNETTLSNADEFAKILTPSRGRKVKLRFEHEWPNEEVEIQSFQFVHAPKRFN